MTKRNKKFHSLFATFLSLLLIASSIPFTALKVSAEEVLLEKHFDFGTEESSVADGFVSVSPNTLYSAEQGYGFSDVTNVTGTTRGSSDALQSDFISYADSAFQIDLPNGDYTVRVVLGDTEDSTEVGVKTESIQKVQDTALNNGEVVERTFDIAVIDGQLTVELTGTNPKINAISITKLPERSAGDHTTVYVASDSTAQTYDPYWKPQAGWGQMLQQFLDENNATVDNHAIGGRSSKTFYTEGRLDAILRDIKPDDYLLIQFGHNDATISRPERYTNPEDFKEYITTYVQGTRQRGGIPILVTPVNRRDFNADTGLFNTSFPEYVQAMKEVAAELDVLLVDFNQLSRDYFNEIGPEEARSIFLHVEPGIYEAYPEGLADDTHFQEYGAIQIARILSGGIQELDTPLANYVVDTALPETVPGQPAGLTLSSVSNSGALLTWDEVENADIYRIYRKLVSEPDYQMVGTSTIPRLSMSGMEEGKTYQVVVTAINGKGESEQSEMVEVTTKAATYKYDFGPVGSPVAEGYTEVTPEILYTAERGYGLESNEGVIFRDRGGDNLLRDWIGYFSVGWDFNVDVPNGLYAAKVYVADYLGSARMNLSIEGQDYGSVNAPSQGDTSKIFPEVAVTDGQMNFHFGGSTGIANGLELTPILLAPSDLTLENQSFDPDDSSATISWKEAEGAASYNVFRKTAGSDNVELIGSTATPSYTDTEVVLGMEYQYMVTTIDNIDTETVPSVPLTVKMVDTSQAAPEAPGNVSLGDVNKNDITLSWDAAETAISYNIYRSEKEDGVYNLVGQTRETSFQDTTVLTTIPYYYKVAAVNAGGISEMTSITETPAVTELKKQMEDLDRAPIAVKTDEGVLVSWRMLGTDPSDIGFNLYRDGELITETPVTDSTNYVDQEGNLDSSYEIHPVIDGAEQGARSQTTVLENNYFDVPLNKPEAGTTPLGDPYTYRANDASVGDLDGDGEYELIVKWDPSNSKDSSTSGYTGNVYLDAYEFDGTQLWRMDLGVNIRAGAHYTQFIVYDFDGDGKAEVSLKTADGTIDGQGNVIGRADADHRYTSGYVLQGDEYLTIFDGETGAAIDTVEYDPPRGDVSAWGDSYGNRVDRFLAGVAYLNGETPSLIMARGYYTRMAVVAYNLEDGKLVKQWKFDTNDEGYSDWKGQGYHSLSIADVDHDQKDEVIYGQVTIDDNGEGLYNSGLSHGDALHAGDFIPDREGLEIYSVQESTSSPYGYAMREAESGEVIWGVKTGADTGRGLTADIDPRYEGSEAWAIDGAWNSTTGGLYTATGEKIGESIPSSNFAIWWDGDLQRELLNHDWDADAEVGVGTIEKWDYENSETNVLLRADGTFSNNHTKGNPSLQADLFGDWREEAVWRLEDSSALRVYMTSEPTDHKIYTLMHDAQYRTAVAWQNVGYNQPPHPSFFIGAEMSDPPTPNIELVNSGLKDSVAPVTTHEVVQEATNDWYQENVTIQLEAVDAESDVQQTYYSVNDGEQQSGTTVVVEDEGVNTVTYWSTDSAGNTEKEKTVSISIDKSAPVLTFSIENGTEFTVADDVTLSCTAEDSLSGIDTSTCEEWSTPAYQLGVGSHQYQAEATDKAGNSSNAAVEIIVTADPASLAKLTEQMIEDKKEVNGLVSKLNAAQSSNERGNLKARDNQLSAFTKQVKAQSGKSIPEEKAQILIELAESSME